MTQNHKTLNQLAPRMENLAHFLRPRGLISEPMAHCTDLAGGFTDPRVHFKTRRHIFLAAKKFSELLTSLLPHTTYFPIRERSFL